MIVVEFPMLPPWIAYTNVPQPALPKPLPIAGTNISLPVNVYTVCPGTLPPHSKKVLGSIPAWGAVVTGDQAFGAQVGYLPGLFVWSLHVLPVFTRVSSTKNPNRKTCKKNRTLL